MSYRHIIVGGGLAAASAIEGIREHDRESEILLISRENHPPYNRPPLSKGLWFGRETLDALPVHSDTFYTENRVTLALRREVVELDTEARHIWDDRGTQYEYDRLLLATGGKPRLLDAQVNLTSNVQYYRTLEDYLALSHNIERLQHSLVIGGGFIGLEIAAALRHAGQEVTLLYKDEYPLRRVLPRDLGLAVAEYYRQHGVETVSNDSIAELSEANGLIHGRTRMGNMVTTQQVVVGIGIVPHVELAEAAGIEVGAGIEVDEYARTTDPCVFAAGDVAEFPCVPLGSRMRVEHWDHARAHGRVAGANMAGAEKVYDHLPMFWSDFFDLGWEAVGELDPGLEVDAVWKHELQEGVLFYTRDDVVRGVLLWNSWNKVEWARGLIMSQKPMSHEERVAAIPPDEPAASGNEG
jgi:3-phenylpropionate/trans-cinnamate dioxygenase ferredoxin reductase component